MDYQRRTLRHTPEMDRPSFVASPRPLRTGEPYPAPTAFPSRTTPDPRPAPRPAPTAPRPAASRRSRRVFRWERAMGFFFLLMAGGMMAGMKSAAPRPVRSAAPVAAVTVYNGSDRLGLEAQVIARLTAAGCVAEPAASPVPQTPLTAVYHVDDPAVAAHVAAALGLKAASAGPAPQADPPLASGSKGRVVIVLGNDFPG